VSSWNFRIFKKVFGLFRFDFINLKQKNQKIKLNRKNKNKNQTQPKSSPLKKSKKTQKTI